MSNTNWVVSGSIGWTVEVYFPPWPCDCEPGVTSSDGLHSLTSAEITWLLRSTSPDTVATPSRPQYSIHANNWIGLRYNIPRKKRPIAEKSTENIWFPNNIFVQSKHLRRWPVVKDYNTEIKKMIRSISTGSPIWIEWWKQDHSLQTKQYL